MGEKTNTHPYEISRGTAVLFLSLPLPPCISSFSLSFLRERCPIPQSVASFDCCLFFLPLLLLLLLLLLLSLPLSCACREKADRLLELGFQEEVAELVKSCPVGRQTLLFSATMNTKVDDLASLALNKVWKRLFSLFLLFG